MEKLLRYVFENTTQGKIEKQTAAKMLQMIKNEQWKTGEEIAIIGVAAMLPQGADLDLLWENIKNNVDFIGPLPESRRADIDRYLSYTGLEDLNEIRYLEGAFLEGIDKFDYQLFKLSPKEASLMDPYQRLFLQVVWSAIEDAGYGGRKLAKSSTGVYVGYASNAKDCYQKMIFEVDPDQMSTAAVGNVTAMMPSRISYLLDLKGPTMVLDTACSSALVSVHTACQALQNGDCEMAIAGSVRMNLLPFEKDYLKFGLESSDGRTRTFDDRSDGAGMGEGIFAVMLKPLSKAIKDRDHIHAVIKGSALNQDGTSIGITAPNPDSQMEVILKAWEKAGVNPESLAYIEAHGTGTTLGDPLELDGLDRAFRRYTDKHHVTALGSVKTNIGHLFESAGLMGMMKVIKMLQHKQMPPNINFNRPNSKFPFHESPFYINSKLRTYESEQPMRCGLSSFGFSGTNCHMVLEEPPVLQRDSLATGLQVFALSARSETSLRQSIRSYVQFLSGKGTVLELADICYTANTGRGHYQFRLAVVAGSVEELLQRMQQFLQAADTQSPEATVSFGEHRIVPQNKEVKLPHEITERDKAEMSRQAVQAIQQVVAESAEEHLHVLATLYVQGADVPWESLYKAQPVCKVSLPVYSFEQKRCWIDVPEGAREQAVVAGPDKYFTFTWKPKALTGDHEPLTCEAVLLFQDEIGLGDRLAQHYRSRGCTVVEVATGPTYRKLDETHFQLAGTEEDYDRLIEELANVRFEKVIHLQSAREKSDIETLADLEANQHLGVYSLFYLTRAIAKTGITRDIDLVLLAETVCEVTGAEARIRPENATLFGMGKVVRKEQGNLLVRCIDFDEYTKSEALVRELDAATEEYHVAYRTGSRFVEEFTEIDLTRVEDNPLPIRENGVYVITGGTGGIGLEVARYLAAQQPVRLVMLNRSPMPARERWVDLLASGEDQAVVQKIRNIQAIESLGSTVVCYSVDVAKHEELGQVLADVRAQFGSINGVVHGAGVGGGDMIVNRKLEDFQAVFAPKVQGTWNLDDHTREDDLDFMVLFSSIASMFSAPAQGEYIAANEYLDSYAAYRNKLGKRTVTINWSTWRETGMSVHHNFTIDTLFKAVMTREAIAGLDAVLNKAVPRALIGEINYDSRMIYLLDRFMFQLSYKIRKELERRIGSTQQKKLPRKQGQDVQKICLLGKEPGTFTEFEQQVGEIWARVLGFAELNIYDNFYELGGDSILGLKIANVINNDLKIPMGVADLLSFVTVADLAQHLEQLDDSDLTAKSSSLYELLQPTPQQMSYPASSAQKRLFIIDQIEGSSIHYNLSKSIKINGPLDLQRLQAVFDRIVQRHEALRTSFGLENSEPVAYVQERAELRVERVETKADQVDSLLVEWVQPYRLDTAPLARVGLLTVSPDEHVMIFDMHHIITDGVSMDLLIQDFVSLYEGRELGLPALEYKDYATWQHRILQDSLLKTQEAFWLEMFGDGGAVLNLPTDFDRPALKSHEGDWVTYELQDALRGRIEHLAKSTGTTLYMLLLSVFNVLLSKYAAQEDIVIGTPILGRPHAELERIVGMFVNTLVLRNRPERNKTFHEFMHEVKDNTLRAYENQDYPFDEFVSRLRLQRDLSRNPLFDVLFVLQNVGTSEIRLRDLEISPYEYENRTSKFDLTLEVIEKEHAITVNLNYCTNLYKQKTAERLLHDYVEMLETVCQNPHVKLIDIELASTRGLLGSSGDEDELGDVEFNF